MMIPTPPKTLDPAVNMLLDGLNAQVGPFAACRPVVCICTVAHADGTPGCFTVTGKLDTRENIVRYLGDAYANLGRLVVESCTELNASPDEIRRVLQDVLTEAERVSRSGWGEQTKRTVHGG